MRHGVFIININFGSFGFDLIINIYNFCLNLRLINFQKYKSGDA